MAIRAATAIQPAKRRPVMPCTAYLTAGISPSTTPAYTKWSQSRGGPSVIATARPARQASTAAATSTRIARSIQVLPVSRPIEAGIAATKTAVVEATASQARTV